MPVIIVRQDITQMDVDAIVNITNTALQKGNSVCGEVFLSTRGEQLEGDCRDVAPIAIVGEATMTPGSSLPVRYIIHTAGPIYQDGKRGEEEKLRSCYLQSLRLAVENGCESIAFPFYTGFYRYPKREALRVARDAIQEFLETHDLEVYLVVLNKEAFSLSEELLGEVASYVDANYVDNDWRRHGGFQSKQALFSYRSVSEMVVESPLGDIVGNLDEAFSETLLRLIDAKGKDDVEVYKKANLDRRLFSKIRNNPRYMPSKRTVLALAIGLGLSLPETKDLLRRAGFALSRSQVSDVIVEYFIAHGRYNIFEVNEVLFSYDQPLLGGSSVDT